MKLRFRAIPAKNLARSALQSMRSLVALASMSAVLLIAGGATAVPIYDYFGPLSEATFGGTGIPNDEVAVASQFVDGDVEITVALSATQRFSNPALTNDGAGTYFALPGSNTGGAGESPTLGALWNANFFLRVEGTNGATPKLADYEIRLYYDFDPGVDTAIASLGVVNVTAGILASLTPGLTLLEGSENMLFGYLAVDVPPFLDAPSGSFDPDALGEYNFAITVSRPAGGFGIETVAMDVKVVPEPGSFALLALGVMGLARLRRTSAALEG